MFSNILSGFLIAVPLIFWRGIFDEIRYPKEVLSVIAMSIIAGYCIYEYGFKPIKNKWIFFLITWCVGNIFINNYILPVVNVGNSFTVVNNPNTGILTTFFACKEMLYIILGILCIFGIASAQIDFKKISQAICIVLWILVVYGVCQVCKLEEFWHVDGGDSWRHYTQHLVGTLGNPMLYSTFLAMILPFAIHLKKYILIIATIIIIILTQEATGIVGMALVMLFFIRRKRILIPYLLLCCAGACLAWHFGLFNIEHRLVSQKIAWDLIQHKPFTGYGLGVFEHRFELPDILNKIGMQDRWSALHNEPLQVWFSIGLIGLWLSVINVWCMLIQGNRNKIILASLSVVFIALFTQFPLRVAPLSFYTITLCGLLLNKDIATQGA